MEAGLKARERGASTARGEVGAHQGARHVLLALAVVVLDVERAVGMALEHLSSGENGGPEVGGGPGVGRGRLVEVWVGRWRSG